MPKKRPYGLPYQGSKAAIASWVADTISKDGAIADYYEPFAGGCAVAHCLLDRGAIEGSCVLNDLSAYPGVFVDGVNGRTPERYLNEFISRERWRAEKDADAWIKFAGSFANMGTNYMYGSHVEAHHEAAFNAIVNDDFGAFIRLCPEVGEAIKDALTGVKDTTARRTLASLTASKVLTTLCGEQGWYHPIIQTNPLYKTDCSRRFINRFSVRCFCTQIYYAERLRALNDINARCDIRALQGDYKALEIPSGAIVYCDPPYAGTSAYEGTAASALFDYTAFLDWACELSTRCRVYISEYAINDERFECIGEHSRHDTMRNSTALTERLYRVKGGV